MEVIQCKFIMIPKLTGKRWYFFMFILGIILRVLALDLVPLFHPTPEQKKTLNYLLTQKYFEIARNIGSSLILGLPHFYYKLMNKSDYKKKKLQTYNPQRVMFIYNEQKSRTPNMLKIILVISSVDIICQLLLPIKYIIEDKIIRTEINYTPYYHLYSLLFFDIFARYFFSRLILKTYFYIHHKLSFLLNLIGLILIAIVDILVKFNEEKEYYFNLLFVLVNSLQLILYSFEDIMNKVAFLSLSILPCTLIFYNGLFQLCYFIIISLPFFYFYYDKNKIDLLFELQYFICFAPFDIIRSLYLIKVIDIFSAQHMTLLKVLEYISIYIYCNIRDNTFLKIYDNDYEIWHYFIQGIGFTFLFVSILIHNEIIIINHPKLKAKTEYYLSKDADNEQNSSFYSDTFFTESKDSASNLYDDLTGSDMS